MQREIIGPSYEATVRKIVFSGLSAHNVPTPESDYTENVIIVNTVNKDGTTSEQHFPEKKQRFQESQRVNVTPITEFLGKGSLTRYKLEPIAE